MGANRIIPPEFEHTLNTGGVTVTLTTSAGTDGAVLVIIDTTGEPDGSDGWRGLRVMVNDGDVFVGVPYKNAAGETVAECVHCGRSIRRGSDAQPWWHADSQLPPCNPADVDPEAYSDCEADKYNIATPRDEATS